MSTRMAAKTINLWFFFVRQRQKFSLSCHGAPIHDCIFNFKSGLSYVPRFSISTVPGLCSQKKLEKPGFKVQKVVTDEGVVEVKKKVFQPRITLIGTDSNLQVLPLDEAEKIAKRRNLKLLNVLERDSKTGRPVYKLVNVSEYLSASKKSPESKGSANKDDKLLTINAKISEHDLLSKINYILKWLKKGQTVRVTIGGDAAAAENVFSSISEKIKNDGRIPQKVFKAGEIRFQILQPKKVNTEKGKKAADQQDSDDRNNPLPTSAQE